MVMSKALKEFNHNLKCTQRIRSSFCDWQVLLWKNSSQPRNYIIRRQPRMPVGPKSQHWCHLFGVDCL